MNTATLEMIFGGHDDLSILDTIEMTAYDEAFEIDLSADQYRNLRHNSKKYSIPVKEGTYSAFFDYSLRKLVQPEDAEIFTRLLSPQKLLFNMQNDNHPGIAADEFRVKNAKGEWVWTRQVILGGRSQGMDESVCRCYIYDIQAQKDRLSEMSQISPEADDGVHMDELTGLLQEQDFFRLAERRMTQLNGTWCAVDVDIDHHTLFTELFGMEKERYLLARFGERLRNEAEDTGGIAGYRGLDHFCLMIPYDWKRLQILQGDLQNATKSFSDMDGFAPMIGICIIDGSCSKFVDFFNRATAATESLRNDYRTRVAVYDARIQKKQADEFKLLNDFQSAIENGEICFFMQPQCRVSDQKVVGAESLARWRRKDGTFISPGIFVPVLEKFGIVTKLDLFIWDSVCAWIREWIDKGNRPVPISVNVSQIDLFTLDVPGTFKELVDKYQLPSGVLKIEITESAYVEDEQVVRDTVERLRNMGFMVLMDDFGSGTSSLNRLYTINVDVIKLDASFLRMKEEEEQKAINILESVVSMTKHLETPVIVEGVETQKQARFLSNIGCRYMQGFYFYKPMPVEQFESLIGDEKNVNYYGFELKPNREIQVRELLDEEIYSNTMLNNILGPVAFYNLHDGVVDIIRYNEQFYELLGIEVDMLQPRLHDIMSFFYPEDKQKFLDMLETAEHDRMNGARGIVRVYTAEKRIMWVSLQVYFTGQDDEGKKFYASLQNVTELQYINSDIPGGYYRCTIGDGFRFLYISQNFQEMTGFTSSEIRKEFDNRLINMVHPADQENLLKQAKGIEEGKFASFSPYRIKKKSGGYMFVAEQSRLSSLFGDICWQSVIVDISEVIKSEDQLRMLGQFYTENILFLYRTKDGLVYDAVVYGLEKQLGMDRQTFQDALNSGEFCKMVKGYKGLPHEQDTQYIVDAALCGNKKITVISENGADIEIDLRAYTIKDVESGVEYILTMNVT